MGMAFLLQPLLAPTWQRPNGLIHVNDIELARIDAVIEQRRVEGTNLSGEEVGLDEEGVRELISWVLAAAEVDDAKLYAYLKTGFLATVENTANLSQRQLIVWQRAVMEYRLLHTGTA